MNIFGEPAAVRAGVGSIDSFSGHADRNELRRYVQDIGGNLKKIFVVHGEQSQALAFGDVLRTLKPRAEVVVPVHRQIVEI